MGTHGLLLQQQKLPHTIIFAIYARIFPNVFDRARIGLDHSLTEDVYLKRLAGAVEGHCRL